MSDIWNWWDCYQEHISHTSAAARNVFLFCLFNPQECGGDGATEKLFSLHILCFETAIIYQ